MPIISKTAKLIALLILIATISLSAFCIWFSWSGLIPILASLGGEIVFFGLWLEKEADDEAKKDEHLPAALRLKAKLGWWILMIGILLEIVTAAGLAAFDLYKNVVNDPINKPVSDISALVTIRVKGSNDVEQAASSGHPNVAGLYPFNVYGAFHEAVPLGFNLLRAEKFSGSRSLDSDWHEYNIQFHSDVDMDAFFIGHDVQVKTILTAKMLMIDLNFLPRDSEILGGSAKMTVNSISRIFNIPPQNNSNQTHGPYTPFELIATNSIPEN